MGRRFEKKSADGSLHFISEFVDKLPPLQKAIEENGRVIYLLDLPPEKLLNLAQATGGVWCAIPMKGLADRFGDEVWKVAGTAMRKYFFERTSQTLKKVQIDLADARDIGRFMDFEDNILGIMGQYVEFTKKRAVRHQFYCPWVDTILQSGAIGVCTEMMIGGMEGTRDALKAAGARLKPLPKEIKLLTTGYPYCELIWELED